PARWKRPSPATAQQDTRRERKQWQAWQAGGGGRDGRGFGEILQGARTTASCTTARVLLTYSLHFAPLLASSSTSGEGARRDSPYSSCLRWGHANGIIGVSLSIPHNRFLPIRHSRSTFVEDRQWASFVPGPPPATSHRHWVSRSTEA